MNNNAFEKVCIVGIILLFGWFLLSSIDSKKTDYYKVDLNNEPFEICGQQLYISNYSYENELNFDTIINVINEACNINGINEAKNVLHDVIIDNSYTKEEILYHIQDAYENLNN